MSGLDRLHLGVVFAFAFVATLIAYVPCLHGDFLWDDAGHVTSPALQSWSGLIRIWFEPGVTQQYYPLLHSAFWLEHRFWGDATVGYHLVNVLWHAISVCLFVAILRRLAVPGALLAGLLFALHPVCVESVAWISEQKNTLSTVFYLMAALAWLRFEDDRRPARYAIASVWFVAALLSKTVTATLPVTLLVVAWWRRGRLSWRSDVLPLVPWLVVGAAAGLFTSWFEQTGIGAQGADFDLSSVERVLVAGRAFWFYLGKLVWPADLTFFYPRWNVDDRVAWQYLFPAAALLLVSGLAWLAWRKKNRRGPLAAFLVFGGTLFPVLGFVNVYPFVFSYVADHFQYQASLAMIALAAAAVTHVFAHLRWPRWSGPATAGAVLLLLGVLTGRQSGAYRDIFSLYETTLARNPSSWAAHLNLGTALDEAGRTQESLPHLQRALELKPDTPEILNSLGNVLNRLGRPTEARPLLEKAIRLQPRFAKAHNTLGASLMILGESDAGIAAFRQAIDINPQMVLARVNLAWALANQRRFPEALANFEQASRLEPDSADLEFKWGLALAMNGQTTDGLRHLARAVHLQPENPAIHSGYGSVLLQSGRSTAAMSEFEEVLRINPGSQDARRILEQLRRGEGGAQ